MNLICGMKVIYLMRLDLLAKIVVERCTRNTTKVPTVWNINYQIIKNNNTTTQKKASGCFSPMLFLCLYLRFSRLSFLLCRFCGEANIHHQLLWGGCSPELAVVILAPTSAKQPSPELKGSDSQPTPVNEASPEQR